ncbi:MAG TPA: hypothetical protein VE262_10810 [Blastocatellia bacterium]|nr:hypothetical protein [Blastocatellia bacterium]
MEKVDRLGWAVGAAITAYGVRLGIRANDAEALDRFLENIPFKWKPARTHFVDRLYSILAGGAGPRGKVRRFNLAYANSTRLARTMDMDSVFNEIGLDLKFHFAESARRRIFVHAGAVGWRGQAIVLPGRCATGKTSLVAELVRAGATYYSDEYAVFDARGRVHPFPMPLDIRDETGVHRTRLSVEAMGGEMGVKPLPVGMVLVSEYRPGATWRPRTLSSGEATLALMANTAVARRQPKAVFATLLEAVSRAQVFKGVRGEAGEMVDALLKRLGD